jgi:hypothetical protein
MGNRILSFRGNLLSSSSRIEMSKRIFRRLETRTIRCPKRPNLIIRSRYVTHSRPAVPNFLVPRRP